MEDPERHFDWDHGFPDISPISNNTSYSSFRVNQSLDKNLGMYTLPEFHNEDKDEFFIYGTCISVRGEQSESRPDYIDETVNDSSVLPEYTSNVEESYKSKINELHKQIRNLEEEASQVPILQDNLRYLYEENVRLHEKDEIKESHRFQNGEHIDSTDEEVEEIVEEEVRTYKKAPKTDPVANDFPSPNHIGNLNNGIDKSQFPSEYWSKLESYFYKRFLSERPFTHKIAMQSSEANKRTTATMACPVKSSEFRCVGINVCPSIQEVGVLCSQPETREFGCLFYETESMTKEWLNRVFPKMEDKNKKIVHKVIRSFYESREEFVSTLLSIIKKSVCHVGIQSQIVSQSRGCSPILKEIEKTVSNPNLVGQSLQSQVSEFVQAMPVLNSRCTMTKRHLGVNAGCLTESPVLRSQGTSPKKDLRSFTTCGVQYESNVELVHRACDPIYPELKRIASSTQTLECSKMVTDVPLHKKDIIVKSYRSTESFEKTEKLPSIQETNDSNSVCITRPSRCDSPRLSQTMIPLSRLPSCTSSYSEGYTVSTERRMVDELSQRYMLSDKVNVDELSSGGQTAFQDVMSKSVDLGSTHVIKEFQPTVEVFHHIGDEIEEVDPSTLPDEMLSPFRVNSPPGFPLSPDFINLKSDHRVRHSSGLSNPLTSDPPTTPPVLIPIIHGQTAKLPESVPKPSYSKVHSMEILKPTAVSWIPVRNYRFILSNEAKKACESLIGYYQAEPTVGRAEEMKDKLLTLVKIWFELAATSQIDLLSIEDFIAILHDHSPSLLRDVIQSIDENNSTCLHYSVGHGAWQVVNLILDTGHAHPDHINRSGFSPIMIATLSNITDSSALKTLSRLFSMGDVNLCTNTSARQSPLMLAALHGGVDICSLLIAHGANINAQDTSGNTALMYAIEHGHIDVVKCLLGCRDLDLTLVDNNDKNALDVAKSKNDLEILNLIQLAYSVPSKATSSTTEISPGTRYAVERRNTHKLLLDLCDLHQIPIPKPIQ
ncbi:unnamed protein product [Schistosoma intercalatum]|nr:unnamed protein product [Schistosoma intercalatum]CAH8651520.1 unnamed protein product [Schistosoma intercalatum]